MKLDTDDQGRLTISPDGVDSRFEAGNPTDSVIVVTRQSTVIEVWEAGGVLHHRKVTADGILEGEIRINGVP